MRSKLTRRNSKSVDTEEEDNFKFQKDKGLLFKEFYFRMPGLSIMNILKFVFFLILISPWIYIFHRNGSFRQISDKVISFYDDKFIIQNGVTNTTTSTQDSNKKTDF